MHECENQEQVNELIDSSTGTVLTPSYHGEQCQGNGDHPGIECCCDECDYYLICFPEFDKERKERLRYGKNYELFDSSQLQGGG